MKSSKIPQMKMSMCDNVLVAMIILAFLGICFDVVVHLQNIPYVTKASDNIIKDMRVKMEGMEERLADRLDMRVMEIIKRIEVLYLNDAVVKAKQGELNAGRE